MDWPEPVYGDINNELAPSAGLAGPRLPTRELARRLGLHANTVSAVYRELEQTGWVESRHGSGVYFRQHDRRKRIGPEVRSIGSLPTSFAPHANRVRRRNRCASACAAGSPCSRQITSW